MSFIKSKKTRQRFTWRSDQARFRRNKKTRFQIVLAFECRTIRRRAWTRNHAKTRTSKKRTDSNGKSARGDVCTNGRNGSLDMVRLLVGYCRADFLFCFLCSRDWCLCILCSYSKSMFLHLLFRLSLNSTWTKWINWFLFRNMIMNRPVIAYSYATFIKVQWKID